MRPADTTNPIGGCLPHATSKSRHPRRWRLRSRLPLAYVQQKTAKKKPSAHMPDPICRHASPRTPMPPVVLCHRAGGGPKFSLLLLCHRVRSPPQPSHVQPPRRHAPSSTPSTTSSARDPPHDGFMRSCHLTSMRFRLRDITDDGLYSAVEMLDFA
ncbi:uncharacterized protein [Triticum aestivum]|uniref:uncharacterized protein n=1 Tax=Triticum aestivum TaxID=4565 RepID=UPI001D01BC05|nr:uncharacterized protein LOC123044780 [Triticum aestivum]